MGDILELNRRLEQVEQNIQQISQALLLHKKILETINTKLVAKSKDNKKDKRETEIKPLLR